MLCPCLHVVCTSYYDDGVARKYPRVPYAESLREHDVAVVAYTSEDLASGRMRRRSAGSGCGTRLSSDVLERYRADCLHPTVSCSLCGALCRGRGGAFGHLALCYFQSMEPLIWLKKESALPGARETMETLSVFDSRGGCEVTTQPQPSNAAAVRGVLDSSSSENRAVATRDTCKAARGADKCDSSDDQAPVSESLSVSRVRDKDDFSAEGRPGGNGKQGPTSVASTGEAGETFASGCWEPLSSLLHGYLNPFRRLVRMIVAGIDTAKDALCMLMPEVPVFVLKACEDGDVMPTARGTRSKVSPGAGLEEKSGTVLDGRLRCVFARKPRALGRPPDEPRGARLAQEGSVSTPVRRSVDCWSELKASAVACGGGRGRLFPRYRRSFGCVIVPGLLPEDATSRLP